MWKKSEEQNFAAGLKAEVTPAVEKSVSVEAPKIPAIESSASASVIGTSIQITGSVKGSEDLLIQGSVQGEIALPKNVVVVGSEGKVEASISARVIRVQGEVVGDMTGVEQIVVHTTGVVRGNISAPRVILEDGAKLKGNIDMDTQGDARGSGVASTAEKSKDKEAKESANKSTNSPSAAVRPH